MLAETSSRELSAWMVYDSIEPIGARRLDVLAAMLMALLANVNRNPKKRRKPFKPDDFMPEWWREPREQSLDQMLWMVNLWNTAFGGKDLRKK